MPIIIALALICLVIGAPPASAQTLWPNEPAGSFVVNDWAWSTNPMSGPGWYDIYGGYQTSIVPDATAPRSPSSVLQQRFLAGSVGGNAGGGGNLLEFGSSYPEIYWGNWMKADANYENHPVCTKTGWIHTTNGNDSHGNQLFFCLEGSAGNMRLAANYQNSFVDNRHLGATSIGSVRFGPSGPSFAAGAWVRVETYFRPATCTTCQNGVWRLWTNGNLVVNLTTLNTSDIRPTGVSHITVWGGTGGTKTRDSFLWWDHEHVSIPDCQGPCGVSSSPPPPPPLPPNLPTNLRVQ